MEIISYKIYKNDAVYILNVDENEIEVELKFDLEENWEPRFNPGSFYGFDEKFSGYYPIDVEFSKELSEEIQLEIEEHLGENYDHSRS